MPRGDDQLRDLAQNDFLRALSFFVFGLGAGAFKLEPVARLYFARPFAVSPPPCLTESFSPRPTLRLTLFFFLLRGAIPLPQCQPSQLHALAEFLFVPFQY